MKGKGRRRKDKDCEKGGESVAPSCSKRGKKRVEMASSREIIESATQAQRGRETSLAKIIPARKASENHINGRCVVNWSCNRDADIGRLAACISAFHDSINFRW